MHACNHVQPHAHFFSSALCLGQNFEVAKPSKEICFPSNTTVLNQLKEIVEETGTQSVFVSSDNDHMLGQLGNFLGKKVTIQIIIFAGMFPKLICLVFIYCFRSTSANFQMMTCTLPWP